jgi:lysophospholipase L1-like esterase
MFFLFFVNVVVILIVVIPIVRVYQLMMKLPENRPANYEKIDGKNVIVFAGDSITHGQVGENYVTMISERSNNQKYDFVNAGINSELAWNLLQRIDEIIECEPEIVTILIGTNDANAMTSEKERKSYVKRMNLPKMPDQEWYQDSLTKIVRTLQEGTQAKIGLISIPPIGEDPNHLAFRISSDYVTVIKEVASLAGVTYLPFHEKMLEYLEHHPGNPAYHIKWEKIEMFIACFKKYILRKDWDSIGESRGFQAHIDYLHLNTKSALILTNLIEEFIRGN